MPFLPRVRASYERGDVIAAAIALIEGLKRDPAHAEGFNWLIDLYCEEIPHTGLEEDLVKVFDACPDPEGAYRYVYQRLLRVGRERFVRRLDRSRREAAARRGLSVRSWRELVGDFDPPEDHGEVAEAPTEAAPVEELVETVTVVATESVRARAWAGAGAGPVAQLAEPGLASSMAGPLRPPPSQLDGPRPAAPRSSSMRAPRGSGPRAPWERPPSVPVEPLTPRAVVEPPREAAPPRPESPWADVLHPALLDRIEGHSSDSWPVHGGADEVRPVRERRPTPRPVVPDWDGPVGGFDDAPVSPSRGGSRAPTREPVGGGRNMGVRRPNSRRRVVTPRRGGGVRRSASREDGARAPWLRKVALVLVVALVGTLAAMAGGRLLTVAERRHAVEGAAAATRRFQPTLLQQAELRLVEALATDPESVELAGRLLWTRSLRAYVTSAATPLEGGAAVAIPPRADTTAWGISARALDALRLGQVEQAQALLATVEDAEAEASDFPEEALAWIRAEVARDGGDLVKALELVGPGAEAGFLPAMVSVVDLHMRRGDVVSAEAALDALGDEADDHPAIPVGEAALDHIRALLANPRGASLDRSSRLSTGELTTAALDRRLEAWVMLADPDFAIKRDMHPSAKHHAVLGLIYAREKFGAGMADEVARELGGVPEDQLTAPLQEAGASMLQGGYDQAGRPDLALKHIPEPSQPGELGAELFARQHPEVALVRASLLADLGEFGQARELLSRLLSHPRFGAEARVVALQMHLAEGRVDDVKRHMERLKDHRGALVADAAVDLYQEAPASAVSRLGPAVAASLPNREATPLLRRFEIRARLLSLSAIGRQEEVHALLQGVKGEVSQALMARVLGKDKGASARQAALAAGPTRLDDLVDLACALLEAEEAEQAREVASKVLEKVPTHAEGNRVMGKALLETGKGKAAMRHLESAARGREDQPEVGLALAEAMFRSGEQLKAIQVLREHLETHRDDLEALALLGTAFRETRRWTMGRQDMEQRYETLHHRRERAAKGEVALQLALLHRVAEGSEKGNFWLDKARRLLGSRPDVLLAQADYLHSKGRTSAALDLYREVAELPGAPLRVHLQLGRCAVKQGQKELAKSALEQYLREAPDGDDASWARREIEKLESL